MAQPKKTLAACVGAGCAAVLLTIVPVFEGEVHHGYRDPIGIVTACVGNTQEAVLGKTYTHAECQQLLDKDLVQHAEATLRCVRVPLTDGQKAAIISFDFNTGRFCGSTMEKKFNAKDYAGGCAELSRWTRAGGRELPGLVQRRATERAICEGKI